MTDINVPLAEKDALTYAEVEALGYCCERTLRQYVSMGLVHRSVLGAGKKGVRFHRATLAVELHEAWLSENPRNKGSR